MPCPAADLFDGHALVRELADGCVGFLAAQIAVIRQALGAGEQPRVDGRGAQHRADMPHGTPDRVQERAAAVLQEVPAVGDLRRIRERAGDRLAIAAAAFARDDPNGRVRPQPALGCGELRSASSVTARRRSRSQTMVP